MYWRDLYSEALSRAQIYECILRGGAERVCPPLREDDTGTTSCDVHGNL
jgi:hypothetical protein